MENKGNSIALGIILGLLTIAVVLFFFYLSQFQAYPFSEYFDKVIHNKKILAPMISLAGVPNLVLFFLFLNKNKYQTARGLIIATFILVILVILAKVLI